MTDTPEMQPAGQHESCPFCKQLKMVPLRFADGTGIRTYTCLNGACEHYRRLIDEDDGDNRYSGDEELMTRMTTQPQPAVVSPDESETRDDAPSLSGWRCPDCGCHNHMANAECCARQCQLAKPRAFSRRERAAAQTWYGLPMEDRGFASQLPRYEATVRDLETQLAATRKTYDTLAEIYNRTHAQLNAALDVSPGPADDRDEGSVTREGLWAKWPFYVLKCDAQDATTLIFERGRVLPDRVAIMPADDWDALRPAIDTLLRVVESASHPVDGETMGEEEREEFEAIRTRIRGRWPLALDRAERLLSMYEKAEEDVRFVTALNRELTSAMDRAYAARSRSSESAIPETSPVLGGMTISETDVGVIARAAEALGYEAERCEGEVKHTRYPNCARIQTVRDTAADYRRLQSELAELRARLTSRSEAITEDVTDDK